MQISHLRHRVTRFAGVLLLAQAAGVCRVLVQVARYRRYWSVPRGERGGVTYTALGDSLAQGVGANSVGKGYVALVADHLRRSTGQPVQVLNYSKSGARLRHVLEEQLANIDGKKADIITVGVGGNDMLRYDAERWRSEVDRLVKGVRGLPVVVMDVPYFMHGRWERDSVDARDYLRRACASAGIPVTDGSQRFRRRGLKGMFTLYASDWFHFNGRGHRIWAESIIDTIENSSALPALFPRRPAIDLLPGTPTPTPQFAGR